MADGGTPTTGSDDVIVLDNVRKQFGSFVAVQGANLSIARGEFFAMLGPSGCGKTTTLKMIAGFELPTSGRVLLEGADVSRVPPYKRNVNTVFQQYALFPHMTVADNVAFGPRSKRVSRGECDRRVAEMLDVVRLGGFAKRKPIATVGRAATARRPRPRPRQLPQRPAARRAPGRPRSQAPRGDAAGAQADPARGRDHVRVRDPRPRRSPHLERPHRRDERRGRRADRDARGDLQQPGVAVRRRVHRLGQPAARYGHRRRRRRRCRRARVRPDGAARRRVGTRPRATPSR